jgi:deazaflavin-dependent oxidoreductase (nitroreductase family)
MPLPWRSSSRSPARAALEWRGGRARMPTGKTNAGVATLKRELPYVDPAARRSLVHRAYARLVGTRAMGWVSRNVGWKLDPFLLTLSGGRVGLGLVLPTALLETTGARTGRPRRNGVIYFHDGDRVTIVASKLGLPEHPAWFHNLRAHPDVRLGGRPYRAEVVDDEGERARLWGLADRVLPAYASYRERAASTGRTIPIVQLVPRD